MNTKVKIGEICFYKDEWRVGFICLECGLEIAQIEQYVEHSMDHMDIVVSSDAVPRLIQQIKGINRQNVSPYEVETILSDSDSDPLNAEIEDITNLDKYDIEYSGEDDTDIKIDSEPDSELISQSCSNQVSSSLPPPPGAIDSIAPEEYLTTSLEKAKPVMKCDQCPKTFNSSKALSNHQRCHKESRIYICCTCGAALKEASNFAAHMKRHLNIRPHKCEECAKSFHTATELRVHIRTHTGERPYGCQICGVSYTTSSQLINHRRRVHTNERPHNCAYCAKNFLTLKMKREHETIHTNVRNYVCPVCKRAFRTESAFGQHKKLHGEKKYTCSVCGKKFAQNAGLHSHMKTHQKTNGNGNSETVEQRISDGEYTDSSIDI